MFETPIMESQEKDKVGEGKVGEGTPRKAKRYTKTARDRHNSSGSANRDVDLSGYSSSEGEEVAVARSR